MASTLDCSSHTFSWQESNTTVTKLAAVIADLHSHIMQSRESSTARSLILVVAPARDSPEREAIERALAEQLPSRSILLEASSADQLDAAVKIACKENEAAGELRFCHDEIAIRANPARLRHVDSLLSPILGNALPIVVWLAGGTTGPYDTPLARRADHLIIDSYEDDAVGMLERASTVGLHTRVHDLVWGRLTWWRATVAAAFAEQRALGLLTTVSTVGVHYGRGSQSAALLLIGWVAARAGWRIDRLHQTAAGFDITAHNVRTDRAIACKLEASSTGQGCGGVDKVVFSGHGRTLTLNRGAARDLHRDILKEALQPSPDFAHGYKPALATLKLGLVGK